MKGKIILLVIALLLTNLTCWSQRWRSTPYEASAGIGFSNYFGDIGGAATDDNWYGLKDLEILSSRPIISGVVRYNHSRFLSFSGSLSTGLIHGTDARGRNAHRKFVFNTLFLEPSLRIEFAAIRDLQVLRGVNRHGMVRNYGTLTAYILGGTGGIIYHVMPNDIQKRIQERNGIDHGFITLALLAGAGIKVGISNTLDIGFELGGRYALTDYIDGYTSEFSTANDIYYLTTVSLVHRFGQARP